MTDSVFTEAWLARTSADLDAPAREAWAALVRWAREREPGRSLPTGETVASHSVALVDLLVELRQDVAARSAALLTLMDDPLAPLPGNTLEARFGHEVAVLVTGYRGLLRFTDHARELMNRAEQSDVLRRMLLAMAADLRLVFMRLASRLASLRWCAATRTPLPPGMAAETLELYAPLANRLGMWQLKWELEDYGFRFTQPERYREIARLLEEKRVEREAYIAAARTRIEQALSAAGLEAEVTGRPKHIYSIHKKMLNKHLDFSQLYDLRAFRVIVPDERSCYTALSVLHALWTPVEGQFDDYISRPKPNGYRSLHTVVQDQDGRAFEIQIRTPEMHRHAEFGVAAHWHYKESGRLGGQTRADDPYAQRLAYIRQLIDWTSEVQSGGAAIQLVDDRIYVLTPQARVIDLPEGSTPIDFAYHLHTDLGHRCRGARVDGQLVPLNTALRSGQTVEVIAAKSGGPSRDWLNPQLGYLASPRARTKVRAWFNAIEIQERIAQGQSLVERELQRLGRTATNLEQLAQQLGLARADDLFIAVAKDEISLRQIEAALAPTEPASPEPEDSVRVAAPSRRTGRSDVLVLGVDSLLTQLARCCRPVPPDEVEGFVTRGRGVTVHRAECAAYQRLRAQYPERCVPVDWGQRGAAESRYPVDVRIVASDRNGLLRDISEVFARERLNVTAVQTQTRNQGAYMQFTVEVPGSAQLARALQHLRQIDGVQQAERR